MIRLQEIEQTMKRLTTIIIALSAAGMVSAQNLTAEIDVERTVVPRLTLQSPLPSVFPSVIPSTSSPMSHTLSEYSGGAVDYTSRPGGLLGPSFTGIAGRSPYRGYAWAGYLPAYNLGIGAGYRFVESENTSAGAAMQFDGSNYSAHLPSGATKTVNDNTFGVQVDFRHRFSDKARVGAFVNYSHAALSAPTLSNRGQSQKIDDFDVALSFDGRHRSLGYGVSATVGRFALGDDVLLGEGAEAAALQGPAETMFGLRAGLGGSTSDSIFRFRLEAGVDMKHRRGSVWTGEIFESIDKANPMIVSLDPTVGFLLGNVSIDLGANVDISSNLDGSSFHVAPQVNVAWTPSARFAFFANSNGGAQMTNLRSIYNYSPFAPGALAYDATFSPVNARAGFSFGPFSGFTAEVYGRYASTRRAPLLAVVGGETPLAALAPTNIKGWGAGLKLGWTSRVATVSGSVEVLQHGADRGFADAPDRAGIVADVNAQVRPIEKLGINAGWHLRAQRSYLMEGSCIGMRNISRLDFGAEYRVTDPLSIFFRLENLLCRRPEIIPGLTTPGLHGLVGAVYRF